MRAEGGQVALRVVTAWAHVPPGQWEFGFPSGPGCRPGTVSPEPIARKTAGQLPVLPQDPARKQFRPVPRSEFKAGSGIVPLASCPTVSGKTLLRSRPPVFLSLGSGSVRNPYFSFPASPALSSHDPLLIHSSIPCSSFPASPALSSQDPLLSLPGSPAFSSQEFLLFPLRTLRFCSTLSPPQTQSACQYFLLIPPHTVPPSNWDSAQSTPP